MLITQEERQAIFKKDLEKISKYLTDRFKINIKKNPDSIYFTSTALEMKYVIMPDKRELKKLDSIQLFKELQNFNNEMWTKLQLFSIKDFSQHNSKIMATIEYKSDIEVIITPPARHKSTKIT